MSRGVEAAPESPAARLWTSEAQLLLCLSRVRLDRDNAVAARRLLAEIQGWSTFLDLAAEHGVTPLVGQQLASLGAPLPPAVDDRLQHAVRTHTTRILQLAGELLRVLSHLQQHGVTVAAYKGAALARQYYGRQTLRQASDLDILAPREHIQIARQALAELGYRPVRALTLRQEQAHLRTGCELALWLPDKRVQLEVHWNAAPAYVGITLERLGLWSRLQTLDWDGTPVAVPAPADLLILLCVHGAKHGWQKLKWICDLHALVEATPELAWPALMTVARELGVRRSVLLGLRLAHELYDLPLPDPMLAAMTADPRVARLSREVCTTLFAVPRRPDSVLRGVAFQLAVRDSVADVVRSGLSLLFQPNARDLGPGTVPWAAGLQRPLRLLAEHLLKR